MSYRDIPKDTHRFDPADEWMGGTESCVNCGKPWINAQIDGHYPGGYEPDTCNPSESHPPFYASSAPLPVGLWVLQWIGEGVERLFRVKP